MRSSGGYHEYIRGFQYIGGYDEYMGGCSVHWRDTMSTSGNIMMHVGDTMGTVEGIS